VNDARCILLDHGSGGLLSHRLVTEVIVKHLGAAHIGKMDDSCILAVQGEHMAMTTDSFVIDPIFFEDGDIGKVAVCGTVNDLAVSGARPRYLTLGLVLEEGFPLADLERVLDSVRRTAIEAGVHIVAGDTKVVRKGEVDKVFINTAGVGFLPPNRHRLGVENIRPGDAIIATSQLGNHTIHILSMREGLGFQSRVRSDCAPLNGLIDALFEVCGPALRFLRDITRGGLGTLLNEVREGREWGVEIAEAALPVAPETAMAADMLGLTPIYLANEGNLCAFIAPDCAARAVEAIRKHPHGRHAAVIGHVVETPPHRVVMRTEDDQIRLVEYLQGAELPRLC
jgi:hydrogenase expression/formation protein HypE